MTKMRANTTLLHLRDGEIYTQCIRCAVCQDLNNKYNMTGEYYENGDISRDQISSCVQDIVLQLLSNLFSTHETIINH